MRWLTSCRTAVLAAVVLAAPIAASAQKDAPRTGAAPPPPNERFSKPGPPPRGASLPAMEWLAPGPIDIPRIGSELGLTEEQKAAIGKLAKQKLDEGRPLIEQLPALYRGVSEIMLASAPDGAAAKSLVSRIRSIHEQLAGIGIDFWTSARAELTSEQNAKLTEILKERIRRGGPRQRDPAQPGRGEPTRPQPEPEPEPEGG